jgi:geranylgeranyl pyrophosphate synthase
LTDAAYSFGRNLGLAFQVYQAVAGRD